MINNSIAAGSFWATKKPFDTEIYFSTNGFIKHHEEKISNFQKIDLNKLWRRKYLFFGEILAISFETENYFYFFESHPGQLYHCDLPNAKISNKINQEIFCFFWYPGSKSCGLKIYSKNELIRHIESEFDYAIIKNEDYFLEDEDEIINISKTFNEKQLIEYLINSKVDLPKSINSNTNIDANLYFLTR